MLAISRALLTNPKLLLFGFTVSFFSSYGQTFFISIFNLEIWNYYNLSDGKFGLLYALATITSSLILVWFAKLIDRIDLRIYSFIICFGLAIACLGFFYLMDYILYNDPSRNTNNYQKTNMTEEYSSNNVKLLSKDELKEIILNEKILWQSKCKNS